MTILVDTGPLIAAASRRDRLHAAAVEWFEEVAEQSDTLLITVPTIVETAWRLEAILGPDEERKFLASVRRDEIERVDLTDDDWQRVEQLIEQYADLGLGTVDSSIVAVAERLDVTTIGTFNERDFRVVRPRHIESFVLVPRP